MRSMFVLVALLIGGCAATAVPSQSPAPTDLVGTDESVIGKVVAIDLAARAITLDVVQWFDGPDAANEAARSDGVIGPAEDLPEPFYVRDLGQRRTLPLASDAKVIVLGHNAEGNTLPTEVGLAEFVALWRHGPESGVWTPAVYYWCTVRDGTIRRIEAQYVP